ncbi:hypothetical protein PTKIN_Ptkin03bG0121300 [Pterospermum kingtungense]
MIIGNSSMLQVLSRCPTELSYFNYFLSIISVLGSCDFVLNTISHSLLIYLSYCRRVKSVLKKLNQVLFVVERDYRWNVLDALTEIVCWHIGLQLFVNGKHI